jgi:hypothetical protein
MVDLLQLLLGGLQSVRGRVELVGLEALIGEADGEGLVLLLYSASPVSALRVPRCSGDFSSSPDGSQQTSGMFSACAVAASVVTERRARGAN